MHAVFGFPVDYDMSDTSHRPRKTYRLPAQGAIYRPEAQCFQAGFPLFDAAGNRRISFGSFANVGVGENNAVSGRIKCVQHSEKFS